MEALLASFTLLPGLATEHHFSFALKTVLLGGLEYVGCGAGGAKKTQAVMLVSKYFCVVYKLYILLQRII